MAAGSPRLPGCCQPPPLVGGVLTTPLFSKGLFFVGILLCLWVYLGVPYSLKISMYGFGYVARYYGYVQVLAKKRHVHEYYTHKLNSQATICT